VKRGLEINKMEMKRNLSLSLAFSIICITMKIALIVPLPGRNSFSIYMLCPLFFQAGLSKIFYQGLKG